MHKAMLPNLRQGRVVIVISSPMLFPTTAVPGTTVKLSAPRKIGLLFLFFLQHFFTYFHFVKGQAF